MFNNQATQLLITLEEDDKQTLSSILQSASHWTNHFNLITGNDGPFPTVTICFDGINALTHFCASGIIAGIDLDVVSLFALDDLIVEVKAIEIYNNGQVVDLRTIAPMGEKFIELAQAYCRVSGGMNTRSRTPRAIRRDRASGFMDLSDIGSRRDQNVLGGRFMSKRFGDSRPTFERSVRQRRRTPDYDVVITVNVDDAYLTINGEGAELLERVVVEGGYVFKFQHPALHHLSEQQINHALYSAGLSTAWIDRESNIISIVVTSDDPIPELDKKEFVIRIDSEPNSHPVIVLEDKDGDIYPHMGEVCDHGFRYQSDLLCGLTYVNVETLNNSAQALGYIVNYDDVAGSIELRKATEETPPVLENKAIIEGKALYFMVNGVKHLVEVHEEPNGIFDISADLWLEDASKELLDSLVESLGKQINASTKITYDVDTIPHILNLNLGKGNTNRGAKQRLREIKVN